MGQILSHFSTIESDPKENIQVLRFRQSRAEGCHLRSRARYRPQLSWQTMPQRHRPGHSFLCPEFGQHRRRRQQHRYQCRRPNQLRHDFQGQGNCARIPPIEMGRPVLHPASQ